MRQRAESVHYDYAEVDRLVKEFQAGSDEAGMKLIDAFSGFLMNFLLLVKNGTLDPYNRSIRRFMSLFVKGRTERYMLLSSKRDDETVKKSIYALAGRIASQFSPFEEEDIWAELVAEFLAMARKYYNESGYFFHVYISKAFPYRAYKRLSRLSSDPVAIAFRTRSGAVEEETEIHGRQEDIPDIEEAPVLLINEDLDSDFGENWIGGITCSDMFADLTPLERRVLVMYHMDGYRDKEIGEILGFSAGQIRQIRGRGRKKLIARRLADVSKKQSGS